MIHDLYEQHNLTQQRTTETKTLIHPQSLLHLVVEGRRLPELITYTR